MEYNFLVRDGDDEYLCESAEELNDLIADIFEYAPKDGSFAITVELIRINERTD